MNIREAILKAADHIEANPGAFSFSAITVPNNCGTPGCAIGWVGHFAGLHKQINHHRNLSKWYVHSLDDIPNQADITVLGVDYKTFYGRMDEMQSSWRDDPATCAANLRLYAYKYHPAESAAKQTSDRIPDSVLRIFAREAA